MKMGGTKPGFLIRPADEVDLPILTSIYETHVRTGTATFEETPPDLAEMTWRWRMIAEAGLPYLVAEAAGAIAGYAYAATYRPRSAYRFSVEDSLYLDPAFVGQGIGRALLGRLIEDATSRGKRRMIAIIGGSENAASIGLHRALGFAEVGTLKSVGFKFGRWLDTVLMQRALGPGAETLPE